MKRKAWPLWLPLGLVALAALLPYLPTLKYPFVWDDRRLIVENPELKAPTFNSVFGHTFMSNPKDDTTPRGKYYRPLVNLSLAGDYQVWKLNPFGYHLHNVLLNVAAAVLFALLLYLVFRSIWPAAIAALFFALHPIHTESVAFVAARTDVLMAVFVFASLCAVTLYRRRSRALWLALAALFFFLALLAKETPILLPLVLLIFLWSEARARWRVFLSLLAPALLYLGLRLLALKGAGPTIVVMTLPQYLAMFLNVFGAYAVMFMFPMRQQVLLAQSPAMAAFAPMSLLGLGLVIAPIALIFTIRPRLRKGESRRAKGEIHPSSLLPSPSFRTMTFGYLLMMATLLPVTNVFSLGIAYAAERLAYLPSAGFIILATGLMEWLAARLPKLSKPLLAYGGVVLIAMIVNLGTRLPTWRSQLALFQAMVRAQPECASAHANLGLVFLDDYQRPDSAAAHFRPAIALAPNSAEHHANLARALKALRDTLAAIREYQQAVRLDSTSFEHQNNLGLSWGQQGNLDSAFDHLQASVRLRPQSAEAHCNLGIACALANRSDDALRELRRAVTIAPNLPDACRNLNQLFAHLGQRDSARFYADRARPPRPPGQE